MFGRITSIYIIGKMLQHWAEELNESLVWWMAFYKHDFNDTIIQHIKASYLALLFHRIHTNLLLSFPLNSYTLKNNTFYVSLSKKHLLKIKGIRILYLKVKCWSGHFNFVWCFRICHNRLNYRWKKCKVSQ